MKGLRQLAEVRRVALALALVRQGARPMVVRAATDLPLRLVRDLYAEVGGGSPPLGPPLTRATSLLSPHGRHRQAALYAALYQRRAGNPARLDGWRVLRAFEQYLTLAPAATHRLDINAAWMIARDLRAGLVALCHCPACQVPLLAPAGAIGRCPSCYQRVPAAPRVMFAVSDPPPAWPPPDRGQVRGPITRAVARRLALGIGLLHHGARLPVVAAATQLPERTLSALYQELHGRSPRSGPLPVSAGALLRPHGRHPHVALYAALYQRRPGGDSVRLDGWRVLRAFEQYLTLAPADAYRLDINAAWMIARDLRAGLVALCRCPGCATPFLRAPESVYCPFCHPPARLALSRRASALSAPPPVMTPPRPVLAAPVAPVAPAAAR